MCGKHAAVTQQVTYRKPPQYTGTFFSNSDREPEAWLERNLE